MVGLEALSMQGLPVDKLLLTRETEDQLADLAGNAMSTTVVGACMLAALVVGKNLLKEGDDADTYEVKAGNSGVDAHYDSGVNAAPSTRGVEDNISGEEGLVEGPLDLSTTVKTDLPDVLSKANASSRLCECEGRSDMTSRLLNRCVDCDTTSCEKCGGRPEHNYQPIDFSNSPRLSPSIFSGELRSALPMSITITGITSQLLDELRSTHGSDVPEKKWNAWRAAVLKVVSSEQRFVELKRQEIWVATFKSPQGSLELLLHPQQPEWRLFGRAEDKEPANSDIRRVLENPIARMRCTGELLSGKWEIAIPKPVTIELSIKGKGEQVPAWPALLGLLGEYKDMTVYPQLEISVKEGDSTALERDITGTYTLLARCGTATNALHRKEVGSNDQSLPPVFLFLDPTRCGTASEDPFVFSTSIRRYQFGESRPVICKLDTKWRQASVDKGSSVSCHILCTWVAANIVSMEVNTSYLFNRVLTNVLTLAYKRP